MYDNYSNENYSNQNNGVNLDNVNPNNMNRSNNGSNNIDPNYINQNNMSRNAAPGQNSGIYSGAYNAAGQTNTAGQTNSTGAASNANTGQPNNTYRYSNRYPNNFTTPPEPNYTAAGAKPVETKKKGGFKKVLFGAGMGVCFGLCAGISFYAVEKVTGIGTESAQTAVIEEKTKENNQSADKAEVKTTSNVTTTVVSDVTQVVGNVMPSVVSIVNTYTQNISYFGQNLSQEESASGSGIIVGMSDTELLVVTNYHVIQDAQSLSVSFVDDSAATAQVKGTDSSMDLAVLAISLEELSEETLNNISVAQLGDSDSLTVGEPAIAIGNALGYGQSVTTGVISALDREIVVSDTASGTFIQTDAAINPGNSGGALLNVSGEVIGINSNKIGGSAIEGMGYAIPISSAKPIIEELMNRETMTKVDEAKAGYLGISGVTVTTDVSNVYGMPEGVYIAQIYEGTGAANAGITPGNIITGLNDFKISSMEELKDALQYYAVGDTVEITIMQGSPNGYEERTVSVTLGPKTE